MFPFNLFSRGSRPGTGPRTHLAVESLEARANPTNAAPVITEFCAVETMPGMYVFYGQVSDETPEGMLVTFGGGLASVAGQTATVDADGWFYLAVQLSPDGTDTGMVSVVTQDEINQSSNVAAVEIVPM
jgi:hypothetical protein